jgi:hypothetical protein
MSSSDAHDADVSEADIEQEYPYGASWAALLWRPPFLAAVTAACVFTALYLDRGVRLWGLIHLPPLLVRVLTGATALGLGVLTIISVRDLWRRLTTRARLALTRDGLLVPGGHGREQPIPYATMSQFKLLRAPDTGILQAVEIESVAGTFTLQRELLPAGALDDIAKVIQREFERQHRPDRIRHREQFWEQEQQREQQYEAVRAKAHRPEKAKQHQILALAFGEVEPKVVAAFETAHQAEEYAQFLRGAQQYQWVRVEEQKK